MPAAPKNQRCSMSHVTRKGGTARWTSTCTMPNGRVTKTKAVSTYHRDRMVMDMTINTTGPHNRPLTMHQHTTGQYVGPCH